MKLTCTCSPVQSGMLPCLCQSIPQQPPLIWVFSCIEVCPHTLPVLFTSISHAHTVHHSLEVRIHPVWDMTTLTTFRLAPTVSYATLIFDPCLNLCTSQHPWLIHLPIQFLYFNFSVWHPCWNVSSPLNLPCHDFFPLEMSVTDGTHIIMILCLASRSTMYTCIHTQFSLCLKHHYPNQGRIWEADHLMLYSREVMSLVWGYILTSVHCSSKPWKFLVLLEWHPGYHTAGLD